ncbi:unnamed protein product [Periconia digitata]|uniref:Uncharacterized protein n=1 Tax=Periconia digitata TaxID=1303443 RepID=A0A9W4XXA2_9PLEO|nr:unnamed protein product [Periconia digitata]
MLVAACQQAGATAGDDVSWQYRCNHTQPLSLTSRLIASLPIDQRISKMQAVSIGESALAAGLEHNIVAAIRSLKIERDTWRHTAEQYQAAFEEQSSHLRELLDICIATQAELENERITHRRRLARSDSTLPDDASQRNTSGNHENQAFGTAIILRNNLGQAKQRPLTCFSRVECLCEQHDYGSALMEVDRLLRGPLASKFRVEGLLIKSDILRKSELLYDALAICSEALELCGSLSELHAYIPKIHYQRGVCYYHLRMTKHARDALSQVSSSDRSLSTKARNLLESCNDQIDTSRRSGFESHRVTSDGSPVALGEVPLDRRSNGSQFRLTVHKGKRFSFPARWGASRSTSCSTN